MTFEDIGKKTSMPNYEVMCNEVEERYAQYEAEIQMLKETAGNEERENDKLKAQMEVANLIFSKINII